jgi:hypothetical protein
MNLEMDNQPYGNAPMLDVCTQATFIRSEEVSLTETPRMS